MQTQQLHVESIRTVANDVYKIILSAPESETLSYQAGQYCMVVMGEGDCRPFSIASSPSTSKQIELHIGAVPENPYAWDVLSQMRDSGMITAQIAHGDAFLQPNGQPIVLIAGGTGYSYVKSIVHECIAQQLTQRIDVYWGAKTLEQIYEATELTALAQQHDNIHFHPVLEHGAEAWDGQTGLVHLAVLSDFANDIVNHQVYIAGPFAMAKVARDDYTSAGLAKESLFGDAYAFLD